MKRRREPDGRSRGGPHEAAADGRDVLELWMALSRWEWKSLVLVPTDPDSSASSLARSLAEIGRRLSFGPVSAISVDSLEYGSALALADLQQHLAAENAPAPAEVQQPVQRPPQADLTQEPSPPDVARPEAAPEAPHTEAIMRVPATRLIISIPPVVREPLGIPAAREADAVVVCLRLGRSRLPDLRRTVDLIGREKITGTVLLR